MTRNTMTADEIIEGAYFLGFEPSRDDLTPSKLLEEAENYLFFSLTI